MVNGVDLYEPRLISIALAIFALSCIDAALTITLVTGGLASEANPLMDALLQYDIQTFVNLKIVLTGGGILFLTVLADTLLLRFVRVRRLLHVLLLVYLTVVSIEVVQLLRFS